MAKKLYYDTRAFALGVVGARNAHFDKLVAFQTPVDFREDRGRQSGSADQYDRI